MKMKRKNFGADYRDYEESFVNSVEVRDSASTIIGDYSLLENFEESIDCAS